MAPLDLDPRSAADISHAFVMIFLVKLCLHIIILLNLVQATSDSKDIRFKISFVVSWIFFYIHMTKLFKINHLCICSNDTFFVYLYYYLALIDNELNNMAGRREYNEGHWI